MAKENAGDFQLSESTMAKLNSPDEGGEPKPEETPQEPISDGQEPKEEETPKEGATEETPKNTFHDQVLERLAKFEDESAQSQFLKDLENYDKFMASNTQKAMEVSKRTKEIEAFASKIGADQVQKALGAITGNEHFLEQVDAYFDGEDNPVKQLLDAINGSAEAREAYKKDLEVKTDRERELELREELLELQSADPSYKEDEKLAKLAELADTEGVTLLQAHRMSLGETLANEVATLNDRIKNLEKELKAKAKELSEKEKIYNPGASGGKGGPVSFKTNRNSGPNWDATAERVREKLGLE